MRSLVCLFFSLLTLAGGLSSLALAEDPAVPRQGLELRDGDRVVFLGGTFIERAQSWGYLESALTVPGKAISFRNLGWSGDTVWAESRGIFDAPSQGYQRMIEQIKELKPTLLLINYGSNESFEGEQGLQKFLQQYKKLLDELKPTRADVVLIGPHLQFNPGPPFPEPAQRNEQLKQYSTAIAELANERGIPFIDLTKWNPEGYAQEALSPNGIHLTKLGYWSVSQYLRSQFGLDVDPRVELTAEGEVVAKNDVTLGNIKAAPTGELAWELQFSRLPLSPPESAEASQELTLSIGGLPAGNYQLQIDGKPFATATADQLESGFKVTLEADQNQAEQLRELITWKNELAFYQWRPQNVTYLFLFRKHEQGNNAKEIPQFDPLITEKEQEISKTSVPPKHRFKLVPTEMP